MASYVQNFLRINDEEEFQRRIIRTLREIFTVLKANTFAVSQTKQEFQPVQKLEGA